MLKSLREKRLDNNKKTEHQGRRLPDVIIGGAMKSGTTSLHNILSNHHDISTSFKEIGFFSIDDIVQHPDFFIGPDNPCFVPDFEQNIEEYLTWYSEFFAHAKPNQIIMEKSTVYLPSEKAPERIARLIPRAKMIFSLRDPVARAYSHYWHLVRTGRAIYGFEKTIRFTPDTILIRSFYKRQVARYKEIFPDPQIKVIIFENFVLNTQNTVDSLCEFIGLDSSIDINKVNTHKNPSFALRSLSYQFLINRIFRKILFKRYQDHLPVKDMSNNVVRERTILGKVYSRLSRLNAKKGPMPKMRPETRRFLEKIFINEIRGLSDLIRVDLRQYWSCLS